MTRIGAALDSTIILSVIALTATGGVMAIAVWRGVLSGNLRRSTIWRKPLLLPSFVFVITLIVASIYFPYPMTAYHGTNQIDNYAPYQGAFRVYESGAYDSIVQLRISRTLLSNERLKVNASFSQNNTEVGVIVMDVTSADFDSYGGVTRSVSLSEGRYDVTINGTLYADGVPEPIQFLDFILNQPVASEFIPEIVQWSSFRFVFGFGCLFLILGGICIGRDERTRRSEEKIDQEPPREGEPYGRRFGW